MMEYYQSILISKLNFGFNCQFLKIMNMRTQNLVRSSGLTSYKNLESPRRKGEQQQLISRINLKYQHYHVSQTLYVGKSSFVFLLVRNQHDQHQYQQKFVIKTISKPVEKGDKSTKAIQKKLKKIRNQISLQKILKINAVIDLIDSHQQSDYFFLQMKLAQKGSLANYLTADVGKSSDKDKVRFNKKLGLQLAKCVKHLHSNRVVHRDLKPQNILLDGEFYPRICDFGLALKLGQNQKISGVKGTLNYIAPQSEGSYDFKVDIWAFGCVLYQIMMGKNMFSIKVRQDLHQNFNQFNIARQIRKVQEKLQDSDLTHLFQMIFKVNPQQRISIDQIINHSFFNRHQMVQSSSSSSGSSTKFQPVCNTEPQPTLSRTKSFMKLETRQINQKGTLQTTKILQNDQNNMNFFNTRLSKLFSYQTSQKSSNTSLCSLRSQRYQKIAARRQNLSREMQKSQAFLIQQNRPLTRKKILSPIKIGKMRPSEQNTLCGKIKITKSGITKQGNPLSNSLQKCVQLQISSDGKNIMIIRGKNKTLYDLDSLPQQYHTIYEYCKDTVRMIRNNTVKIKIDVPDSFQICLMESGKIQVEIKERKYNSYEQVPQQCCQKEQIKKYFEFLKSAHSE